jgi:hypothetical protein
MNPDKHNPPTQNMIIIASERQVEAFEAANASGRRRRVKPAVRRRVPGTSSSTNR